MHFWKKVKQTAIVSRLVEEKLYEQVLCEIESGIRRRGLWAKAFQKSRGNEEETKALYIEYRVQSIKDEAEILTLFSDEEETPTSFSEQYSPVREDDDIKPIDKYGKDGYTPLMRAVKKVDVGEVLSLIEKGANPDIMDEEFGTSTALDMARLLRKRVKTEEAQQGLKKVIDALEPITECI